MIPDTNNFFFCVVNPFKVELNAVTGRFYLFIDYLTELNSKFYSFVGNISILYFFFKINISRFFEFL